MSEFNYKSLSEKEIESIIDKCLEDEINRINKDRQFVVYTTSIDVIKAVDEAIKNAAKKYLL